MEGTFDPAAELRALASKLQPTVDPNRLTDQLALQWLLAIWPHLGRAPSESCDQDERTAWILIRLTYQASWAIAVSPIRTPAPDTSKMSPAAVLAQLNDTQQRRFIEMIKDLEVKAREFVKSGRMA